METKPLEKYTVKDLEEKVSEFNRKALFNNFKNEHLAVKRFISLLAMDEVNKIESNQPN